MKSVKHKGLALIAVSGSVFGLGVGVAGSASALAWVNSVPGPTVDLKVQGTVAGTGSSAVLTVNTDSTGSTGQWNSTDFGDGSKPATSTTATHAYAAGALKQTLTETSQDSGTSVSSTAQVGVDATDASHIVYTRSVPIDLAAPGALVTKQGDSVLDLSKVLPATADLSRLSGTCDSWTGALALSVDATAKTAVCDWTNATAASHIVTLTYTDKATGLTSTSQESVWVPIQPVATFRAAVPARGQVQLDLTGSAMDAAPGSDTGTIAWGDGSTTSVSLPLHNNAIQTHQYTVYTDVPKTVTFSITDRFGEHASSSAQVDDWAPNVDYGQLTRFAGSTRYGTGIAASQAAFPYTGSAGAVVLARGDSYADALAGIPLAKYKDAPLLLTPGGPTAKTLDPDVAAEIKRVLPFSDDTVYILGGTDAVPQSIQDYIEHTLGYKVERFGGADRYETALDIAQNPDAMHNPARIVVARGDDFADALASGPFAATSFAATHQGDPAAIVLSTGDGITEPASLTPDTAGYVTGKLDAPRQVPPLANVAAVGGGAVKAVSALKGAAGAFTPIAGADRYETAAKVAAESWGTLKVAVGVASGTNFPDALTGGALMAQKGYPLLLSDPNATSPALSPATGAILAAEKGSLMNTYLFGGTQVFGDRVAQSIMQLEGLSVAHYRIVALPF